MMRRHLLVVLIVLSLLTVVTGIAASPAGAAEGPPSGSFALSGQEARDFRVPSDAVAVRSWSDASGRSTTRYQQMVGGASVFGGQITVTRDASGTVVSAVGAHVVGLQPKDAPSVGAAAARGIVEREVGRGGQWRTTLRLDPATASLFYEVQSLRDDSRPLRWIDAGNGAVRKAFDALAEGDGTGVKGDTKTVDSRPASGGGFELVSPDARRITFDARNKQVRGTVMVDADDHWDFTQSAFRSPDQRPGVDAHYYADVVDDFYGSTFGRDSIDDNGMQTRGRRCDRAHDHGQRGEPRHGAVRRPDRPPVLLVHAIGWVHDLLGDDICRRRVVQVLVGERAERSCEQFPVNMTQPTASGRGRSCCAARSRIVDRVRVVHSGDPWSSVPPVVACGCGFRRSGGSKTQLPLLAVSSPRPPGSCSPTSSTP